MKLFMEIELPQSGPVLFAEGSAFPTIGALYSAIAHAYAALPSSAITGDRQIAIGGGTGAASTITDADDAAAAIARIKEQGEGSTTSPVGDPNTPGDDLAHYYQFAEIFYGRRLVANADGVFEFTGAELPFPQVLPMAEVPAAGYPESADFDKAYTEVLGDLQQAWETGDQPVNGQKPSSAAVGAMFGLESLAVTLMTTPRTDGPGNLGPDFKLAT
ncbi:ferritin-like domain-containing protein [Actinomycetospora sp. TBRC 11914]|uniref:ferritin-like domain-containing protein n=1 Tax=Actinomycetospora sp. TBRC 11914 TaxID=2729387 RepID=UPI00145DCADC|nr:ferritin-like domain-containing protein [Actinomycetospora sp. TBRC 11914]NMO90362.1 hypothetical protein [Actinomycetospora sp. TBRC 11914]